VPTNAAQERLLKIKPDLALIKLFLTYEEWNKYNTFITASDIQEDLRIVYRCLDSYHKVSNEEKKDLSVVDLSMLVLASSPKNREFYEEVFNNLNELSVTNSIAVDYIDSLHKNRVLRELAMVAYESSEGKKPFDEVAKKIESLNAVKPLSPEEVEHKKDIVNLDLEQLVQHTVKSPGLRWRLRCLNESLGSLRRGDFGFIFARPETGKTTFLASEVSYMLTQTDKPILWCNNEEQGEKVALRVYQAFFGAPLEQILANVPFFNQEFKAATGNRLVIVDSAQLSKLQMEAYLQEFCPVIGVSQADGSGEGVRYLTMQNVANAKTSKQAEADWILGIGCVQDQGYENVRFFNISKNKLMGDEDTKPALRHGKFEALIMPIIARYQDIK
jgi:replicative DNA helicase